MFSSSLRPTAAPQGNQSKHREDPVVRNQRSAHPSQPVQSDRPVITYSTLSTLQKQLMQARVLNESRNLLHDPDLAAAILDRGLERGLWITLDGPSGGTKHLKL